MPMLSPQQAKQHCVVGVDEHALSLVTGPVCLACSEYRQPEEGEPATGAALRLLTVTPPDAITRVLLPTADQLEATGALSSHLGVAAMFTWSGIMLTLKTHSSFHLKRPPVLLHTTV